MHIVITHGFDHPAGRQHPFHINQNSWVQAIYLTSGIRFIDGSGLTAGWYIIHLSTHISKVIVSEKLLSEGF